MEAMELIRIHLALECKGIDVQGQLHPIPCANPDTFSRVYVVRHDAGDTIFFSHSLPKNIRQALKRLPIREFFENPEQIKAILAEDGPCEDIHIGKSYVFPTLVPRLFTDVVRLSQVDRAIVEAWNPEIDFSEKEVFGVIVDGVVASTCESSREDAHAGEAWVQTHPDFRRRGFARQVTAAWAHHLHSCGKIPFYSHKWDNMASQAVAQSLGLIQYIADAAYA